MRGAVGKLCACILLCALAIPAHAQGDTDRLATATSLFEAAQKLVQDGQAERACPMFEESFRLEPANGTLINLADCYERVGKTASAWLTFRQVAQRAAEADQDARAEVARKRIASLKPRLSRLRILVGDNASVEGLTVTRDAVVLKRAALGVPVAVDPGEHHVVAKAAGHGDWERTVRVQGEGTTLDVTLPKLQSLMAQRPAPTTPGADPGLSLQTQVGIAALVIGGAGVIVGVALGGAAKAKADDADCDADNFCSPDGLSQRDDAVLLGNIGTGVGAAGAAFALLGITLVLVDSSSDASSDANEARLRIGPNGVTVAIDF